MMSATLKPCPFCGGCYMTVVAIDAASSCVICGGCSARGPLGRRHHDPQDHLGGLYDAMGAWNARETTSEDVQS